jgi:hypothetical protein
MPYTENDIEITATGHCLTKDHKYIIVDCGNDSYWYEIKAISGGIVSTTRRLGSYAYGYVFYSPTFHNIQDNLEKLNKFLSTEGEN